MQQLKHEQHFVSQLYLKNWADNKNRIWSYQLLVPRENFPKWKHLPIGGVAFHRDLYTVITNGQEDDSFERWIESEFETPVRESLVKAVNDKKLTNHDWNRLALFLAAQDVRTPTNYFESTERWNRELPKVLDNTLNKLVQILEEHFREGKPIPQVPPNTKLLNQVFDVSITTNTVPEKNMGEIRAKVVAGRRLWVETQRLLLTKTSQVLLKHKWSIVEPASGMSWFTSDHPVLRLNYYEPGKYDLRGGWGREGGNLIMPLSPRHLLYTQIGSDAQDRFAFSIEKTYEIQKFLAERAFRWIFAHKKLPGVVKLRPRYVNLKEFNNEEEQWRKWHQEQNLAEEK